MDQPAHADPTSAPSHPGLAVGLPPGMRYRCEGCGNLTRFDVDVSERSHRFWHVALSGIGSVEEATVTEQHIQSVTCRWCGSSERITTEPAPAGP